MKLSMGLGYAGGFKESVQRVVELEKAGLDQVWVAEAYSFDAISQVGYLAAMTNRIEIGTGIVNVYSTSKLLVAPLLIVTGLPPLSLILILAIRPCPTP